MNDSAGREWNTELILSLKTTSPTPQMDRKYDTRWEEGQCQVEICIQAEDLLRRL